MRQRGKEAWELRVYQGIDPDTRRQRWLTRTVHGTQRFARAQLEDLVAEAGRARIRAGTLADLLDQWIEAASPGWSASTVSHTRSIVECHLKPNVGYLDLAKLTTADIDDFYAHLLRAGGRNDRLLGTSIRSGGRIERRTTPRNRIAVNERRWAEFGGRKGTRRPIVRETRRDPADLPGSGKETRRR